MVRKGCDTVLGATQAGQVFRTASGSGGVVTWRVVNLGPDIATNMFASFLYDVLKGAVGTLRKRRDKAKWVTDLAGAVARRGLTLSPAEAKRFAHWVQTWDLEQLTVAESGNDSELARVLEIDVFGVADHTNAPPGVDLAQWAETQATRADQLVGLMWGALNDVLTPAERRQMHTLVSAKHTEATTASILTELGWVHDDLTQLADLITPTLPLERARLRPPPGSWLSPYELLWPRFGVVPFDDRAGRLDELAAWCDDTERISVQIITGSGGMGKTRLALELCRRMGTQGWLAGMYRANGQASVDALIVTRAPRLVVLDYADDQPVRSTQLLDRLAEHMPLRAHRIRVLLLVRRNSPTGDARRLFATGQTQSSFLFNQRGAIALSNDSDGHTQGERFALPDRQRLFRSAVEAFSRRLGVSDTNIDEPPLEQETYASPLFVAAAAVLAVDPGPGVVTAPTSSDDLLDRILEREQAKHWHGCPEADPDLQQRIVALATLLGADSEDEMAAHLEAIPGLANRVQIALWLHRLYRGQRWANPLEPDLLGERLVTTQLTDRMIEQAFNAGARASGVRAVTVLARIARSSSAAGDRIRPKLHTHLERLVGLAIDQEAKSGEWGARGLLAEPLAWLVQAVELHNVPFPVIARPVGPAVGNLALQIGIFAVDAYQRLATTDPQNFSAVLAEALNHLSIRMAEAGQFREAVPLSLNAVSRYRAIQDQPNLAAALCNLSSHLARVGDHKAALIEIELGLRIFRTLAIDDEAQHLPGLAAALNNASLLLVKAGRREEGLVAIQEAVDIRTCLAIKDPGIHEPDLATSRSNLSVQLAELGRFGEAFAIGSEAAAQYRKLVQVNAATYLPDLAMSLSNLSSRLLETNQHDAALSAATEAVGIRREIARANPWLYNRHLEKSLKQLAQVHAMFGDDTAKQRILAEIATLENP